MGQGRNRGSIIPRGDKKYLLRMFTGKDATGKRLYASKTFEGTISQAKQELTRFQREVDTKTYVKPSKESVAVFCTNWLAGREGISNATRMSYEHRLKPVIKRIGGVSLENLTETQIQTMYKAMREEGLSTRTIHYTHTVLSLVLRSAVRKKLLQQDPSEFCELPKKEHKEVATWSVENVALFLEHTAGTRFHALWFVLFTAGLRPQEALALQWDDIDFEQRMVKIRRALIEESKGVYQPGDVKTKNGKRTLGLPQETITLLKDHQKRIAVIAPWVFPTEDGSFYGRAYINKQWDKAINSVNAKLAEQNEQRRLPRITPYGARHTHMSLGLSAEIAALVMSKRAGHGTVAITLDTYTHPATAMDRQAADKIGALIFGPRKTG